MKKEFYTNGKLKEKYSIKNDVINGSVVGYFESGKIHYQYNTYYGKISGEKIEYYETGNVEIISDWSQGIENGYQIGFFENGNLQSVYKIRNGKFEGNSYTYFKTGKLKYIDEFRNDKKIYSEYFDSNGRIYRTIRIVYVKVNRDTIELGEEYTAIISVSGRIKIPLNVSVSYKDDPRNSDSKTYCKIIPKLNDKYIYKFKPQIAKKYNLTFHVYYENFWSYIYKDTNFVVVAPSKGELLKK